MTIDLLQRICSHAPVSILSAKHDYRSANRKDREGTMIKPSPARSLSLWLAAVVALMLTSPLTSHSFAQHQDSNPMIIKEIRFQGLVGLSASYVHSVIRSAEQAPFDQEILEADVTRLLATGRFAAVDYTLETSPEGVVVTFTVQERPRITDIRFVGNDKLSDAKLRKLVPVRTGDAVDTFRIQEGVEAIALAYRDAGYGQAVVTYDRRLLTSTGELLFTVEEGPRIRIRKILLEGNQSISRRELLKHASSNTFVWIFQDGKFDEETVQTDAAAIQSHYRDQGYLDARVGYRLQFSDDQEDLEITFTIVEGVRYLIETVSFSGSTVMTNDELTDLSQLQIGEPVLQRNVDRAVKSIGNRYGEIGHIYARTSATKVFSNEPGLVNVLIEIDEGEPFSVGRIVVRGNERTKDKVVRRELDLYPGETFNMTKAKQAEDALRQTQLFSLAAVKPVGTTPGVRDILMTVEEGRKAGDFLFGFGVTSNSGLVGSLVLDLKNFDLFDTPRTFSEFIKLKAFHGAGQRMRIEAQPGTEVNRFRIDFTEPYLMDKPVRFDTSVYLFERGRESYDERRAGAHVSIGRRLKWSWLKDWYGELALRVEAVSVRDLDIFAARDIREVEGQNVETSASFSLVRDRTDNRLLPSKGDKIRFSYEQFGVLGGEDFFGRVRASYTWHKTVKTDELERKSILSLKGVLGAIVGEAPVFERFYAGGIGSLRGFEFRGISPRMGLQDDPVGGKLMVLLSAEYSFPLYGEMLRGLVFADTGTVEEEFSISTWRAALGTGIRLHVDFFGPVPLEFAVAAPIALEEDDEDQIFSFYIGATF